MNGMTIHYVAVASVESTGMWRRILGIKEDVMSFTNPTSGCGFQYCSSRTNHVSDVVM